jgi:hypothetical protein
MKIYAKQEAEKAFDVGMTHGLYRASVVVNRTVPKRPDNAPDKETYIKSQFD